MGMNILVFNCGSSSLNYKLFEINGKDAIPVIFGKAHRVGVVGTQAPFIEHHHGNDRYVQNVNLPSHSIAAEYILDYLGSLNVKIDAIGHRFVHGGSIFHESTLITASNLVDLEACLPLAPIHNPNSFNVIKISSQKLPGIPEYLTFDTAFHSGISPRAYSYTLPKELVSQFGYRKYGFHGLSYSYVIDRVARYLCKSKNELKIIACHLGTGGSSALAYKNGFSYETSMGYSPLSGLMMSTRTGDLDPLILLYLLETTHYTPDELETFLNKKSGILGISRFSSDLRDIQSRIDTDKYPPAELAHSMVSYRITKFIGAYAVLLKGFNALIFTDDIGAQNWRLRESVCKNLEWLGICIDPERNRNCDPSLINCVSTDTSNVKVISMPTDEEWVIAHEGYHLLSKENNADF